MKPVTKDIDIIVRSTREFLKMREILTSLRFLSKIPTVEYKRMNLSQIFMREDYRIDLFDKTVCKGFSLSEGMKTRAERIIELKHLSVYICSKEDVFLFKTLTEREGDLEDCIALARTPLRWKSILEELQDQIKTSGKDVWITWVGERLDILEERGLHIPFMKEMNQLRDEYLDKLESRFEKRQ